MTSLQYLLTFAPMLDNFKSVPIDKKFGDLIVHWSINVQKKFKKNLSTNFVLIAVSVKVALTQYRNTVRKFCNIANYRAKIDETPIDLHRFVNGHVYFKLYLSRVFVTSSMYAPEINLWHCEKTWEDLDRYNDLKARSSDALPISS